MDYLQNSYIHRTCINLQYFATLPRFQRLGIFRTICSNCSVINKESKWLGELPGSKGKVKIARQTIIWIGALVNYRKALLNHCIDDVGQNSLWHKKLRKNQNSLHFLHPPLWYHINSNCRLHSVMNIRKSLWHEKSGNILFT